MSAKFSSTGLNPSAPASSAIRRRDSSSRRAETRSVRSFRASLPFREFLFHVVPAEDELPIAQRQHRWRIPAEPQGRAGLFRLKAALFAQRVPGARRNRSSSSRRRNRLGGDVIEVGQRYYRADCRAFLGEGDPHPKPARDAGARH